MKKTYLTLVILAVVFGVIGHFLGWFDNGPRQNYDVTTLPSRLDN